MAHQSLPTPVAVLNDPAAPAFCGFRFPALAPQAAS